MPWRVTQARWLTTEADRVQGILLVPGRITRTWTAAVLAEDLRRVGLTYTAPQLTAIVAELVTRGVLEQV